MREGRGVRFHGGAGPAGSASPVQMRRRFIRTTRLTGIMVKAELFLDRPIGALELQVEVAAQHREHGPDLEQGEVAAGAESRAAAEGQEGAGVVRAPAFRAALEPALRVETGRVAEVLVPCREAPVQRDDDDLRRDEVTQDLDVLDGLHAGHGRHRLQPHRLVEEGIDKRESGRLLDLLDRRRRCEHRVDFRTRPGRSAPGSAGRSSPSRRSCVRWCPRPRAAGYRRWRRCPRPRRRAP